MSSTASSASPYAMNYRLEPGADSPLMNAGGAVCPAGPPALGAGGRIKLGADGPNERPGQGRSRVVERGIGRSTLHQLRHSAITHLAEGGVDIALLKAKSRHQSLRSLERYACPSEAAVAKLTADHDRDRRR
jgi:hypothetical protein